ncbi:MAG TPA: transcriptional regulator NrdR [Patescibacteria group bacterium]
MKCPVCQNTETKVTDSRVALDSASIRRRRECVKCNFRFSTIEQMTILDLAVIKRDGRREPYSREKLERGLVRALEKRPYTKDKFQGLVNQIETDIQKLKKSEITSHDLGEVVMKRLKKFDKVAYIRFASVYRSFEDVKTFQRELSKLANKKRKKK